MDRFADRARHGFVLLVSLLLLFGAMTVPAVASGCGASYTIRRGDTLGAIARRCDVGVSDLAEANGLKLDTTIYPNQRLVVPRSGRSEGATWGSTGPTAAGATCSSPHTVQRGDTLSRIASRCGVSVAALKQWNNLRSDTIRTGQKLNLAGPGAAGVKATPLPGPQSSLSTSPAMTPTPAIEPAVSHW